MRKQKHQHYNTVEEYKKLTRKELLEIQQEFRTAVEKYPKLTSLNEHLGFLDKTIAERIGNRLK